MYILKGTQRRVFIFNKSALKIPLNIKGWLSNINEIHNWYRYKQYRKHLCPIIFHDLLGVLIIMKRVQPINSLDDYDIGFIRDINEPHPVFNDIKESNFGLLNGNLVKIDYGNDYWLYNVWIDIKNKIINKLYITI